MPAKFLRAAQALAINAVSIYGVFGADWPVGTAIALYWAENVLRAVLLLALRRTKLLGLAMVFNAVHAVFLGVILFGVFPRAAPAERFESGSFLIGLAWIGGLLLLELIVWLWTKEPEPDAGYFRRIVVIHLTIVFGMFGIVFFERATVLFAAFAAMKVLIDLFAIRVPQMARVEQAGGR